MRIMKGIDSYIPCFALTVFCGTIEETPILRKIHFWILRPPSLHAPRTEPSCPAGAATEKMQRESENGGFCVCHHGFGETLD